MKKSSYAALIQGALMTGILASCSNLNIPLLNRQQPDTRQNTPAELPTDREHIRHSAHNDYNFSITDLEKGLVTGDWTIESVNGEPVVAETPAFIKFVPAEKRIYGNNGCNTINATYSFDTASRAMKFSELAATMRMCSTPGITDLDINAALANTTSYSWDHSDDEYFLYLRDANGVELLKLLHQNFDFLNGAWVVTAIEDEPVDNPDMQLVIDVDSGKIHGNTGCNILNGTMDVDMETANTLSFQDIVTTRMACPDPSLQTRLIVALEDAAHAKPIDADHVMLLNLLRKPVLSLRRLQ
ncbi:MAG: META domain-containing protein [Muribaculaceae bacterium]|nr:META domain-containing protein [Muribaculaceae bacterium]